MILPPLVFPTYTIIPLAAHIKLGTCWELVGNLLGTCWELVGNLLGTCWELVGNLLGTCWELDGNLLGACTGETLVYILID